MPITIRPIDPRDKAQVEAVADFLARKIYRERNRDGLRHRWITGVIPIAPWIQGSVATEDEEIVGAIIVDISDLLRGRNSVEVWGDCEEDDFYVRLVRETLGRFFKDPIFKRYKKVAFIISIGTEEDIPFFRETMHAFDIHVVPDAWDPGKHAVWAWSRLEDL